MTENKKQKKGYFYEKEEQAIVDYINANDLVAKNKIYNTILHPALTKMIESIMRRYNLCVPDEEFEQTFNDTISYLLTKINNFNAEKGTKAYSYCGTVCKNYLLYKKMQFSKEQQRSVPYDDMLDEFIYSPRFTDSVDEFKDSAETLIKKISSEIRGMLSTPEEYMLNENEIKVGTALAELLDNWEEILVNNNESNKLQKSSVLYFLREETMMSTKEVRDNMKKYKTAYNLIKKSMLEE